MVAKNDDEGKKNSLGYIISLARVVCVSVVVFQEERAKEHRSEKSENRGK